MKYVLLEDLSLNKSNLKDQVYDAIMEDIYEGILVPGDVLNEKKLIDKYHCSKSPVREALVSLCADHVVRSIPRYGYEVTRLTLDDIYEMLSYRYYIEVGILQERAGFFTEGQISELEELNRACMEEKVSPREHWEANVAFHKKMIHFCGNHYVEEQIDACFKRLTRAYAQFHWGQGADSKKIPIKNDCMNHEMLLGALRQRDPEKLVEYLKLFRKVWSSFAG